MAEGPTERVQKRGFPCIREMMGAMRSGVCSGIFRSSTNLAVFENMLSTLSVAKTTGPESSSEARFDQFRSSPGGGGVPQATEAPEIPTCCRRWYGMLPKSVETTLVLVEAEKNTRNAAERE